MGLTKLNQQLRASLLTAASLLEQSSIDRFKAAKALMDNGDEAGAEEMLKVALTHQDAENNLKVFAEQVKAGQITRIKLEITSLAKLRC